MGTLARPAFFYVTRHVHAQIKYVPTTTPVYILDTGKRARPAILNETTKGLV